VKHALRRTMDVLYFACALLAGTAFVAISAVIPWGVFTRYVLNSAASWPEPRRTARSMLSFGTELFFAFWMAS